VAGEAAYELGRYAEAVERLTDAVARLPSYRPNATTLGFAHYKLGQFAQAATVFRSIVALKPDAYKAHYGLGHVALAEGRTAEARAALEEALRLQPGYLKARFDLGRVLQEEGRLEESAQAFEAVLERWPSHDEALFRLAQVRAAQGRQADADAVLARRAEVYALTEEIGGLVQRVRAGTDTPETWQRIVVLQDRLGEDEQAASALRDGLQRFPEDPGLLELQRAGLGAAGSVER
jgi:tetratricopeptide (TPR) repeat protein